MLHFTPVAPINTTDVSTQTNSIYIVTSTISDSPDTPINPVSSNYPTDQTQSGNITNMTATEWINNLYNFPALSQGLASQVIPGETVRRFQNMQEMLTNFRGSAIDNTGMNETLRNVIRVLAVIESAINHSRHEELAREVCLRLRRFLESVATYTKNEFNRILGRLNQFQAMVNSTNLPITTSLAITANSRMNIKFFVRYDDHIPLI